MTYKTAKLNLNGQAIVGSADWVYSDTGMTVANAVAAGAFTDAGDKGMKVGDRLDFRDNNTGIRVTGRMTVVQSTGATQGTFVQDTQ